MQVLYTLHVVGHFFHEPMTSLCVPESRQRTTPQPSDESSPAQTESTQQQAPIMYAQ